MSESSAGIPIVSPETYSRYEQELEREVRQSGIEVGCGERQIDAAVGRRLRRERGESLAAVLDRFVDLQGKLVLDVGSGFGEFVLACLARGSEAKGIEPDQTRVQISLMLLESFGFGGGISQAPGEDIPFADGSFDIVVSQHVLEHVRDRNRVVAEMVRVTRPGGHLLVSVPNYLFPYEGHYKIRWIPLTPKPLGGLILRLRGRDPRFLRDHVHYTTYPTMMRLWRRHDLEVRNLTRELVASHTHPSDLYKRRLLRFLAMRLQLFPTVTWLLRKPI